MIGQQIQSRQPPIYHLSTFFLFLVSTKISISHFFFCHFFPGKKPSPQNFKSLLIKKHGRYEHFEFIFTFITLYLLMQLIIMIFWNIWWTLTESVHWSLHMNETTSVERRDTSCVHIIQQLVFLLFFSMFFLHVWICK